MIIYKVLCLLVILFFAGFVIACVEAYRWRKKYKNLFDFHLFFVGQIIAAFQKEIEKAGIKVDNEPFDEVIEHIKKEVNK